MIRVVFNQKGGVGKSTLSVNLAAIAAEQGQRVLLVDLDTQANASHYLLGDAADEVEGVAELFAGMLSFKLVGPSASDYLHDTPVKGLKVMVGSQELAELQIRLEQKYKIYKLREALAELSDDFDEIWIDTPPAWNIYSLSALIAADEVLLPMDCDAFSRRALDPLLEAIAEVRNDHNEGLRVAGIIINQFQAGAKLPRELAESMKADGLPVLEPMIPSTVRVRESHQQSQPLTQSARGHKITEALRELYANLAR